MEELIEMSVLAKLIEDRKAHSNRHDPIIRRHFPYHTIILLSTILAIWIWRAKIWALLLTLFTFLP